MVLVLKEAIHQLKSFEEVFDHFLTQKLVSGSNQFLDIGC